MIEMETDERIPVVLLCQTSQLSANLKIAYFPPLSFENVDHHAVLP